MPIKTVGVCGAGTMGRGIAQTAAQASFSVLLYDVNKDILSSAKVSIEDNLRSLVKKEKITNSDAEKIAASITYTTAIEDCKADIFIEAIVEKTEAKIDLFNKLAEQNEPSCILASNTSSLSITAIAKEIAEPERVIGLHFFNPATLMKLVEIVSSSWTSKQTIHKAQSFISKLGKTAVLCSDAPGFIVNRVARPYYIEALRQVESGASTYEQIDRLLEASGFKMGPFKLMDLIGNDINFAVSCSVYEQLHQVERLKPSYIQQQLVREGNWGKKSGKGFYPYK